MLDLTLKVVVDGTQAKAELSSIERSVQKVESAAKSTEKPIANVANALKGHKAEVDGVVASSARLEQGTKSLTTAQSLHVAATAEQLRQQVRASLGMDDLHARTDKLESSIATMAATTVTGTLRFAAYGLGIGAVAAAMAGFIGLLASSAKHYFETSEATAASRLELERLGETWELFQTIVGRSVLGGQFSIVTPLQLMETWLIRVGIKLAADIELYKELAIFAANQHLGPKGAAAVEALLTDPMAVPANSLSGAYHRMNRQRFADAAGLGALTPASEAQRLFDDAERARERSAKMAEAEAKRAIETRDKFFQWLYFGRESVNSGISSAPGNVFEMKMPTLVAPWLPDMIGSTFVFNGRNTQFSGLPSMPGVQLPMPQMPTDANGRPFKDPSFWRRAFGGQDFGRAMLNTIQGGGKVGESLIGFGGSAIGSGIVSGFSDSFGKSFLGQALGSFLPGIGALAGPLLSKLFGGLFGPSKGKKEDMAANESLDQMRSKLLDTYGSLDRIRQLGALTGDELADAFGHRGKKGLEQFQQQVSDFERRQERLQTAIEKYGFTWEELGPKVQRLKLHDLARELTEDMEILLSAGLPVEAVFSRMAPQFNNLVQMSMAAGIEVPNNLKPIMEKLLEMGLLVDADGKKLTDLSGITFSESMTEGLDRGFKGVIEKLDELLIGLGIKLPAAAAEGAAKVREAFNGIEFPEFRDRDRDGERFRDPDAHRGGYIGPYGPRMHRGGEVGITAQVGEFMMQRSAVSLYGVNFMRAVNSGSLPAGPSIHIDARGSTFLSEDAADEFIDLIERKLASRLGARVRFSSV